MLGPTRGLEDTLLRLGFVQLDSINTVARAHELILHSRLPGYAHESLWQLLRSNRAFEHWTHDASLIPVAFLPYWQERFRREARRILQTTWWTERMGGHGQEMIDLVLGRIEREGPLESSNFESEHTETGGWWNWKPEKAALEFLWRSGQLTIADRRSFRKVYDLADRHLPPVASAPDRVEWACRGALERLGMATPAELAAYWRLVTLEEARDWAARSDVPRVRDWQGKPALAVPDWRERAAAYRPSASSLRLLAPFDPILRDRKRAQRLFDFDFRFEAFVPAARRVHGYYTMAILEGEHLVGRFNPKLQRKLGLLESGPVRWERRPSPARVARWEKALERLSRFVGADRWQSVESH